MGWNGMGKEEGKGGREGGREIYDGLSVRLCLFMYPSTVHFDLVLTPISLVSFRCTDLCVCLCKYVCDRCNRKYSLLSLLVSDWV